MFFNKLHVVLVLATCSFQNTISKKESNEEEDFIDVVPITSPYQGRNDTKPEVVWKFLEYRVVPNIIPIAPQKPLQVVYKNNIAVNFGNEIAATDIIERPTKITWPGEKDKFYCLYMTGIRYFPNYTYYIRRMRTTWKKPPKWEWHHWIVGNIPGNKMRAGESLWAYGKIVLPISIYTQEFVFLVYEQSRKMRFSHKPKHGKWTKEYFRVHQFARYHGLGDPVYGNFFKQGPPVGNHSLSYKTDD